MDMFHADRNEFVESKRCWRMVQKRTFLYSDIELLQERAAHEMDVLAVTMHL